MLILKKLINYQAKKTSSLDKTTKKVKTQKKHKQHKEKTTSMSPPPSFAPLPSAKASRDLENKLIKPKYGVYANVSKEDKNIDRTDKVRTEKDTKLKSNHHNQKTTTKPKVSYDSFLDAEIAAKEAMIKQLSEGMSNKKVVNKDAKNVFAPYKKSERRGFLKSLKIFVNQYQNINYQLKLQNLQISHLHYLQGQILERVQVVMKGKFVDCTADTLHNRYTP